MEDATETTKSDEQERLARDQHQYHRGYKLVSRDEFYQSFPQYEPEHLRNKAEQITTPIKKYLKYENIN
jgi:hypothetical protein